MLLQNQDIGDADIVEGSRSLSHVNSELNAKEVKVYESNGDDIEEENRFSEDNDALRDSNYELYDEYEYGYHDTDYGTV